MLDGHQLSFVLHMQIQERWNKFATAEPFFFWLAKKLHGDKDPGSSLIAVKAMKKVWGCHTF